MDWTRFYEWKRRFQTQGFEGLKDLPPIHKSHQQTTTPETVEKIKALEPKHPPPKPVQRAAWETDAYCAAACMSSSGSIWM